MRPLTRAAAILALLCASTVARAGDLTRVPAGMVGGLAPSATTDTTNAGNIASGTLPGARLTGIAPLLSNNLADLPSPAAALANLGGLSNAGGKLSLGAYDGINLARGIGFEPTSPVTVPTTTGYTSEADVIRMSGDYIVGPTGHALFSGLNFQLTMDAASNSQSETTGVLGQIINNSPGIAKALYGRADCTNSTGTNTAICIAGVLAVNTGINANSIYNLQMNAVVNGGRTPDAAIWLSSVQGTDPATPYKYGLLMQNIAFQNAAVEAFAFGPGDFLTFNSSAAAHLFEVDHLGHLGVGTGVGSFGLGEAASIEGIAAFSSGGITGFLGPSSADGTIVFGSVTANPVEIRYDNAPSLFIGSLPSAPPSQTSAGHLCIDSGKQMYVCS